MSAPTIKLNNGCEVPVLGLGTWQSPAGEVNLAVKYAIDCGYRHFDCAFIYGNEKEIGDAVKEKIADGTVKREDLFITSKLWNTCHRPDLVVPSCKRSLENFGLDYLDLYLIHWPLAYKEMDTMEIFPVDENGDPFFSDVDYLDTWKEMEQCVKLGLVKSIGLSNFNSEQIERILSITNIKPVMNQIEAHPLLNQKKLVAFCKNRDIAVTAYSPLASPARPWVKPGDPVLHLDDPRLQSIADKYKKTTTQVVLRYLIDIGMIPIPKSVNKERIRANINIFDFKLTLNDIAVLDTFNCNARICPASEMAKHKHYPFHLDF